MTGTHAAASRDDDEPNHPAFQQTAAELETRIRFLLGHPHQPDLSRHNAPQEEK